MAADKEVIVHVLRLIVAHLHPELTEVKTATSTQDPGVNVTMQTPKARKTEIFFPPPPVHTLLINTSPCTHSPALIKPQASFILFQDCFKPTEAKMKLLKRLGGLSFCSS